jgi:hypothetical protein
MQTDNRYYVLLTDIILLAMHIKLQIINSNNKNYILTKKDYLNIQHIKELIEILEETDTVEDI